MRGSLIGPQTTRSVQFGQALPRQRNGAASSGAIQTLRGDVLEAVASGQSLDHVLCILCRGVEQLIPAAACSVLSIDDSGQLHGFAAPVGLELCFRLLDEAQTGPGRGLCGAVTADSLMNEVCDVGIDPRWAPCRAELLAAGLRVCWPNQIKRPDGNVAGTFSLYYDDRRAPSARERRVVEASVQLCALAIEHERVKSGLEWTNRRFDMALGNMSQGLCFFDGTRHLIVANRRYSEIYELAPDSIRSGMSLREIIDLRIAAGSGPKMAIDRYLVWRDTLKASSTPSDSVVELRNGRTIAIHRQPMPDSGWVATHEDITRRLHAEARIVYLARHDELTGLPNRAMFQERIEQALALAGRGLNCAVLCLDLDHFKTVNDTFSHAVGDGLLKAVATRLRARVRKVDTVARLGSDEFAILLVGLKRPEDAAKLAQRVARTLAEPFDIDGHAIITCASGGIAVAPCDGKSPGKLLKSADTALYRAKLDDRGTYRFFEADMDARLQARVVLARDLREAMAKNEFTLVYQPIFNLEANAICCFEALLRWRHPVRGLVSPAEFVPMAEETGLIAQIGAWVLRQACAEASNWPGSVKVAVNLSAAQFKDKALVATIARALSAARMPATRLELEITESMLLKNTEETLATLHRLRHLGASISMDDFGTGYSSLSYLRSFPFDKIKIDQSFIRDLAEKPELDRDRSGDRQHGQKPGHGDNRRGCGNRGSARTATP